MESASLAPGGTAAGHGHHHGPPEAHESSKIDRQTLGILLFIVSEAMLFGAFFAAYFFIRAVASDGAPWPPEPFELPVVVATQTVNAPDLVERLLARHREHAHRYTFVCPASGNVSREEVCDRLAATLATLYREEIDATGQPMSPEPYAAVENAIEHYRVDDILISTFAGRQSKWIEEGLLDQVRELTDKPVEHVESGGTDSRPATAGVGAGQEGQR